MRGGVDPCFAAGAAADLVVLPAAAEPVVAGSGAAGAGGSAFMMLTGGIDAEDGRNISPRGARPIELDAPVGLVAEGIIAAGQPPA